MLSTQLLYEGLTGYQNLEYSAHLYRIPKPHLRIMATIQHWGLSSFIREEVASYSNGMRALLALARCTLHSPPLLLLDEPTAYLDTHGIDRLRTFLQSSTGTVLITTQQPNTLKDIVDRVLML